MMEAGRIDIVMSGPRVDLVSTRAAAIGNVFKNRDEAFVQAVLPRLFAVCGEAQSLASKAALAAAHGRDSARDDGIAVVAEAVREHLMRIAVDWRKALKLSAPQTAELRAIYGLPKLAAAQGAHAFLQQARQLLTMLAAPPSAILRGLEAVPAKGTVATDLLHWVIVRDWQSLGQGVRAAETSALDICRDVPALAAVLATWGDGLLARLYARLVHLALLLEVAQGQDPLLDVQQGEGWGEARVATSRGVLSHRVHVHGGNITSYAITAPTDINFAKSGPAVEALEGLHNLATAETLEPVARLLTEAFDPCVAYSLRVH
jgi:hypothetical protein